LYLRSPITLFKKTPIVETKPARRIEDNIKPKDPASHKLNLDRRIKNNERRVSDNPNYTGPVRRFIIDRRMRTRDRRVSD